MHFYFIFSVKEIKMYGNAINIFKPTQVFHIDLDQNMKSP